MDKKIALERISREIELCTICKVGKIGVAVPGEGNPDATIVFIGEAPGKQEAVSGRPFIGRSGKLLRKLIREIGLDDEKEVYITSPVKYLPERGTPTPRDIAHGRVHLMKQLEIIDPHVIVLLGRVAAEGVLQEKVSVMAEHGKPRYQDGNTYFLTYHPAAALRFQKNVIPLREDFRKLQQLL